MSDDFSAYVAQGEQVKKRRAEAKKQAEMQAEQDQRFVALIDASETHFTIGDRTLPTFYFDWTRAIHAALVAAEEAGHGEKVASTLTIDYCSRVLGYDREQYRHAVAIIKECMTEVGAARAADKLKSAFDAEVSVPINFVLFLLKDEIFSPLVSPPPAVDIVPPPKPVANGTPPPNPPTPNRDRPTSVDAGVPIEFRTKPMSLAQAGVLMKLGNGKGKTRRENAGKAIRRIMDSGGMPHELMGRKFVFDKRRFPLDAQDKI